MFLHLAATVLALLLLKAIVRVIYNLFFHPLRHFPGPLLNRATRLVWLRHLSKGRLPYHFYNLHEQYGPVVRTAPDELSFTDPAAWKDIYGHQGGKPMPVKWQKFYKISNKIPDTILTADSAKHTVLRRALAPAFSDKSMREQEPIIGKYVSLLIERLNEVAKKGEATNMVSWYTFTTFDIIGDLAMGSPFHCLDGSDYHPWVKAISQALFSGAKLLIPLRLLGITWPIDLFVLYGNTARKRHMNQVRGLLKKRMQLDVERPDFIEPFVQKKGGEEIDMDELEAMASTLIVAGSETTATFLCGITYLLLTNPEKLKKVSEEVRSSFRSESEITLTSVNKLTYMLACLNESFRMYSPIAGVLPRIVPPGGMVIAGTPVPEKTIVGVPMLATFHTENNWNKPWEYHPERFLGDAEFESDKLDALQPFSVGPRNCVGKNLSYAEMRLVLARILYNFDMKLADDSSTWIKDQQVFVLWRKVPLNVYFTPIRA